MNMENRIAFLVLITLTNVCSHTPMILSTYLSIQPWQDMLIWMSAGSASSKRILSEIVTRNGFSPVMVLSHVFFMEPVWIIFDVVCKICDCLNQYAQF